MKEKDIQNAISKMLLKHPSVAWAYVTSAGRVKAGKYWMTIGFPGLSDILGQLRDGRTFAIEVKQPGKKPTEIQQDFIDSVNRNNGLAGWCDSVEGAMEILDD